MNKSGLDLTIFERYDAVINTSPTTYNDLATNVNYIHLPVLVC
jgi:hypothetical protein